MAALRVPGRSGYPARSAKERPPNQAEDSEPAAQGKVNGAHNNLRLLSQLTRTIEGEIIPRLLLAHNGGSPNPPVGEGDALSKSPNFGRVAHFADLILQPSASGSYSFIEEQLAKGMPVEALMLDILAPAARHLGKLWEADLCDFTEVTLGLMRLQNLLRLLRPPSPMIADYREPSRRALLLPAPGEQHTFGIVVVEEFFRRSGWDVSGGPSAGGLDATSIVRNDWYDIIGLSLSCETRLEALALLVRVIRQASVNRGGCVMVGGHVFTARPELAVLVGADTTAADAQIAVTQAETLLGLTAQCC